MIKITKIKINLTFPSFLEIGICTVDGKIHLNDISVIISPSELLISFPKNKDGENIVEFFDDREEMIKKCIRHKIMQNELLSKIIEHVRCTEELQINNMKEKPYHVH